MSASHVIVEKVPPRARPASPVSRVVRSSAADQPAAVPGRLTLSLRAAANTPAQGGEATRAAPPPAGTLTLARSPQPTASKPDLTPLAVPPIDLESLPRAERFLAVARPRWPWLFPPGDGWVPPLAIGVLDVLTAELEGVLSKKLIRTGLHHWTKSWRYRRSLTSSVGRPRYSPDRTHGGKVSGKHASHAKQVLAQESAAAIEAKKAAAKAQAKAAKAAFKTRQAADSIATSA